MKNRNQNFFQQIATLNQDSMKLILSYAKEINQAFNMAIVNARPTFNLIKWILPPAGRIKLNTDGCRKIGGDGGFGGLFRDEAGTWLCGY